MVKSQGIQFPDQSIVSNSCTQLLYSLLRRNQTTRASIQEVIAFPFIQDGIVKRQRRDLGETSESKGGKEGDEEEEEMKRQTGHPLNFSVSSSSSSSSSQTKGSNSNSYTTQSTFRNTPPQQQTRQSFVLESEFDESNLPPFSTGLISSRMNTNNPFLQEEDGELTPTTPSDIEISQHIPRNSIPGGHQYPGRLSPHPEEDETKHLMNSFEDTMVTYEDADAQDWQLVDQVPNLVRESTLNTIFSPNATTAEMLHLIQKMNMGARGVVMLGDERANSFIECSAFSASSSSSSSSLLSSQYPNPHMMTRFSQPSPSMMNKGKGVSDMSFGLLFSSFSYHSIINSPIEFLQEALVLYIKAAFLFKLALDQLIKFRNNDVPQQQQQQYPTDHNKIDTPIVPPPLNNTSSYGTRALTKFRQTLQSNLSNTMRRIVECRDELKTEHSRTYTDHPDQKMESISFPNADSLVYKASMIIIENGKRYEMSNEPKKALANYKTVDILLISLILEGNLKDEDKDSFYKLSKLVAARGQLLERQLEEERKKKEELNLNLPASS